MRSINLSSALISQICQTIIRVHNNRRVTTVKINDFITIDIPSSPPLWKKQSEPTIPGCMQTADVISPSLGDLRVFVWHYITYISNYFGFVSDKIKLNVSTLQCSSFPCFNKPKIIFVYETSITLNKFEKQEKRDKVYQFLIYSQRLWINLPMTKMIFLLNTSTGIRAIRSNFHCWFPKSQFLQKKCYSNWEKILDFRQN